MVARGSSSLSDDLKLADNSSVFVAALAESGPHRQVRLPSKLWMAKSKSVQHPTYSLRRFFYSQHDTLKYAIPMRSQMRTFRPFLTHQIVPRLARSQASLERPTMFRSFTARRSIFSTSRLPLRVESRRQRGHIANVQSVRFVKPKWPARLK